MNTLLQSLRRTLLRTAPADVSDAQLLESFLEREDEGAFEALVRRHCSMVMGVCRRLLRHHHDAEDAFQATFLVLARKAKTVQPRERLGNWLYGVAYRTALEARGVCARHRAREQTMANPPELPGTTPEDNSDLCRLLDRELNALPDHYRVLIVLCELEGKSRKEAARLLGLPEGTLSSRLARGKQLLARRLRRTGLALGGGLTATLLCHTGALAQVPGPLVVSTAKAATLVAAGQAVTPRLVSIQVAALMEGVLKTMLLHKLTKTSALILIAVLVAGAIAFGSFRDPLVPSAHAQLQPPSKEVGEKPGDPKGKQKPAAAKLTGRQLVEELTWTLLDVDEDKSTILVDDLANFDENDRKTIEKAKDDGETIPPRLSFTKTANGADEVRGLSARLSIDAKVKVSLDGKESKLPELKAGMVVSVTLSKDGATVVRIEAKTKLKETKTAGPRWEVKEADAKGGTLSVGCKEKSMEVLGIPMAKNASILLLGAFNDEGTITDLKTGWSVTVSLRSDKDKGIVISNVFMVK
jgi:RNA polymerase sigma factor (sigma-70 family)